MKYSIKKSILIVFPVLLLCLYSCGPKNQENDHDNDDSKEVAEDRNDDKFDDKDSEKNAQFVVDAVTSNLAEIRLATTAEARSSNKEVKEIATMLKTQHTELLNNLKSYAAAKVISIPTEAPEKAENKAEDLNEDANDDHKKDHDGKVANDDNKDFDVNWCAEMKDMHEKSIKRFEDASTDLSDAELKNLAAQALPTLRTHYDRIVACHDKLKK